MLKHLRKIIFLFSRSQYFISNPIFSFIVKQIIQSMVSREGKCWRIYQTHNVRDAIADNFKEACNKGVKLLFRDFVIEEQEGSGTYGNVYRIHKINKQAQKFAMKVIDLQKWKGSDKLQRILELTKHEEKILKKMDSIFILKLHESFYNEYCIVFILEYCNGGNLLQHLTKNKDCLNEMEAIAIIKQICLGLFAFYDKCIMHRDLKLENIMISNGICKIIDLGFSKEIDNRNQEAHHTLLGSYYTMAPEVIKGQPYGVKADIYSLGIILLKLVVSNFFFDKRTPQILTTQKCLNKKMEPLSKNLLDFLIQTTKEDPSERIGWDKLLKHPVFQNHQHITQSRIMELIEHHFESMKNCSAIDVQSLINQNDFALRNTPNIFQANEDDQPVIYNQGKNQGLKDDNKKGSHPQIFEDEEYDESQFNRGIYETPTFNKEQQKKEKKLTAVKEQQEKEKPIFGDEKIYYNNYTDTTSDKPDQKKKNVFRHQKEKKMLFPSEKEKEQRESVSSIASRDSQSKIQSSIYRDRYPNQEVRNQINLQFSSNSFELRLSQDLYNPLTLIKWTSSMKKQMNSMNLLYRKTDYIIKQLLKPLQNGHKFKIFNSSSESFVRLRVLLSQRALLDLQTIQNFNMQNKIKSKSAQKVNKKVITTRAKYIEYSQWLNSPLKSKARIFSRWLIYRPQSKEQKILEQGKEGSHFSREQQIKLTVVYINEIKNFIHIQSYKKKLVAYEKIMALDCNSEQFPALAQSIINKC